MNKTLQKVCTGAATIALLSFAAIPGAFADTGVKVTGNGAFSDSDVYVSHRNITDVEQSNNTDITNKVTTHQNTGHNKASFNTGGSVTIYTGDAATNTHVSNTAGSNYAVVGGNSYDNGYSNIWVHGNGAFSDNSVSVRNWDREEYRQNNRTYFRNYILNHQDTGHNSANFNTGTDVKIVSGDTDAWTTVHNQAGSNVLY